MQRLSQLFEERNLRVRETARAASIDPSLLSKYLRGIWVPGIDKADALGDVLGLSGRQVREMAKADKAARKANSARQGVA